MDNSSISVDSSLPMRMNDCAVCVFFDAETEAIIRELWTQIASAGISSEMPDVGWRPHITLAGCDQLDILHYESALQDFSRQSSVLPITFSSVGCFVAPKSTLFLAPTITQDLLDLHRRHQSIVANHALRMSHYYLPDQWVPHCTLALNLTTEALMHSIEVCQQQIRLPIVGTLVEIGVVQVKRPKVNPLYTFPIKITTE